MTALKLIAAAVAATLMAGGIAVAEDTMKADDNMMAGDTMMAGENMMMATKMGEVIAISPSGMMGTAMMEGDKMMSTVGMSAPLDHCVMFITGEDGKVYQVDTTSKMGQDECEMIAQ